MIKQQLTVLENRKLNNDTFLLELKSKANIHEDVPCGGFVNLTVSGLYLRRPISVCDYDKETCTYTLIVKTVGEGTRLLSEVTPNTEIDTLTGLGNGFDINVEYNDILLVGGGVGVAPLYMTAKKLVAKGKSVNVVLGFRNAENAFYVEEFKALGCHVLVATEDGSLGVKGFVTDAIKTLDGEFYAFVCGPTPMMKAVYALERIVDGQFSLEERMGCGYGACVGCSIKTADGTKRICKDGPVFRKKQLLWEVR